MRIRLTADLRLWQSAGVSEANEHHRADSIPQQQEMESRMSASVVVYDDNGTLKPGGSCRCCGSEPNPTPEWRAEPWYVYKAMICDVDGVFYSMLCEGCLEDVREQCGSRLRTARDEAAALVAELLGDDLDGAEAMMEDLPTPHELMEESKEQQPALFNLGQVCMTPGVAENTTDADRLEALGRHHVGDWGDVPPEDASQNKWAIENDARILSAYISSSNVRFWIITEADRSVTTLLLPEEY